MTIKLWTFSVTGFFSIWDPFLYDLMCLFIKSYYKNNIYSYICLKHFCEKLNLLLLSWILFQLNYLRKQVCWEMFIFRHLSCVCLSVACVFLFRYACTCPYDVVEQPTFAGSDANRRRVWSGKLCSNNLINLAAKWRFRSALSKALQGKTIEHIALPPCISPPPFLYTLQLWLCDALMLYSRCRYC